MKKNIKYFVMIPVGVLFVLLLYINRSKTENTTINPKFTNIETTRNRDDSIRKMVELKEKQALEIIMGPKFTVDSIIGTYEYIQPANDSGYEKLLITINEDETAVAKLIIRGEEKTYYGYWSKPSRNGESIPLNFTDNKAKNLDVWINGTESIKLNRSVIKDDYLYANNDMAKAKNPEYRVKLKKIN